MSEGADERERYALLRWFARDGAVDPRAVCYRCVTTDEFSGAAIVGGDDDAGVVASAGDDPGPDAVSVAGTASREGTVQVLETEGRTVAAVPLRDGELVLVLATTWTAPVDDRDRAFLEELGAAASAALERDGRRSDGDRSAPRAPAASAADDRQPGAIDDARGRRKLQALQVTAENLVRARSKPEIARVAVETARDVLDCPITGIWLYEAETDTLDPAAVTDEGRELLGEPVSFDRGESLAWAAFESGEIGHYDDVRTVEGAYNPDTPIRSELNIPIGDHGVLTTATTRLAEFTEVDLDLLRILVSNTEAVLDRAAHERDIERYREMVEAANDPIWAVDMDGRLTHVNQRFVDRSDHDRQTLVGSPMSLVFPEDVVERAWTSIDELRTSDRLTTTIQESFGGVGGERGTYQISLSLLPGDGDFRGAVFVAHDVTELRRNQQLLSVFNRILRHNLRNQMNLVLSQVDRLAESDDESVAERGDTAAAAARTLLALSEKTRRFQDVIVPERGALEPVDLSAEVDGVVSRLSRTYPGATIRSAVPADVWVHSNGSLSFAIEELVENGIEHNDGDAEVEVAATVTDGGTVELRVTDDGPGIPEVERQSLTQHLEQPLKHSSGLGLWMVRWTADTAGGTLEIREAEPRGTTVVMHLPRAEGPDGEG